jgi:hypothetical protein
MTKLEKKQYIKEKRDKAVIAANTEYEGMMWLVNNDVPINLNNVIYYEYRNLFVFGFNKLIPEFLMNHLISLLSGFPFRFKLKVGYTLTSKGELNDKRSSD